MDAQAVIYRITPGVVPSKRPGWQAAIRNYPCMPGTVIASWLPIPQSGEPVEVRVVANEREGTDAQPNGPCNRPVGLMA